MTGIFLQGRLRLQPWPKSFVTQMLRSDLLAAANLLVFFSFVLASRSREFRSSLLLVSF